MKAKTLAVLAAAATLLVSSYTQAASIKLVADEMNDAAVATSTNGDNIANPDMSSINNQANNDLMPGAAATDGNNGSSSAALDSANSNDDMSADTATGDDDY